MQNLNDALKDLKDRLKDQKYTPELLKDVADDWEINPALLIRKFKEQTGKDPSEFKMANAEEINKKTYEKAKEVAVDWAKRNIADPEASPVLGQPFDYEGIPHIAAAWTSRGLYCVDARNLKVMVIRFSNREAAMKFLMKNVVKIS